MPKSHSPVVVTLLSNKNVLINGYFFLFGSCSIQMEYSNGRFISILKSVWMKLMVALPFIEEGLYYFIVYLMSFTRISLAI